MSIIPSRGHLAEEFRVDVQARVQRGDLINSMSQAPRFHNKYFEVPQNPSTVFTGREEIGRRLRFYCLPSHTLNSQQKRFVIYGLGGSGKTQVCLKFAKDHREQFWGIFWIDASSAESLERGYLQIAKVCDLEPQVEAVKQWLSNISESWALILDNADDPRLDISPYFPVGNRGIVLITTRNPDFRYHATVGSYQLGGMEPDEAVMLILKTTGVGDRSDELIRKSAEPVVATLGFLALAIVQAGAVIRQGLCTIEEYSTIFYRRRSELLSRKAVQNVEDYPPAVYTTLEVSLKMIEMSSEAGRDALELLQIFSFLHHDGISEEIFHRAWKSLQSDQPSDWILSHQPDMLLRQSSQEWDVYPFRAAVSTLQSFSLINCHKDNLISIHPLVHTWTRDRLRPLDKETIRTRTTLMVALSIPWTFETIDYRFRKFLVPHINACLGSQNDGIFYLRDIGEDFQMMAAKFALAYSEGGQLQEALQLTEQVVEASKRTLGEEHPDTLRSMHNLANRYSEVGRQQEALQLMKHVVEARKGALGEEHPETVRSMHNLANRYSEVGRQQEALQLTEHVLEVRKRTLGSEHPGTLHSIDALANRYSEMGRWQEALQLAEHVVEARKRTLGKAHPQTIRSMDNLANRYSEVGRRQEALQLAPEVVEARMRPPHEVHPDTLGSVPYLATRYSEEGRRPEALQLPKQVVEAQMRALGGDHPESLSIKRFETDENRSAEKELYPDGGASTQNLGPNEGTSMKEINQDESMSTKEGAGLSPEFEFDTIGGTSAETFALDQLEKNIAIEEHTSDENRSAEKEFYPDEGASTQNLGPNEGTSMKEINQDENMSTKEGAGLSPEFEFDTIGGTSAETFALDQLEKNIAIEEHTSDENIPANELNRGSVMPMLDLDLTSPLSTIVHTNQVTSTKDFKESLKRKVDVFLHEASITFSVRLLSMSSKVSAYWKRHREPPLASGKIRIRWTCQCGERLWDDFEELRPGAAENLQRELDSYKRASASKPHGLTTQAGGSSSPQTPAPVYASASSSGSTDLGFISTTSSRSNQETPQGSIAGAIASAASPRSSSTVDKENFLLLCSSKPNDTLRLSQHYVGNINNDVRLFGRLNEVYTENRGRLTHFFSLRNIKSINFRQFERHPRERVVIRLCSNIKDILPRRTNPRACHPQHSPPRCNTAYDIEPAPPDLTPYVGQNGLEHLLKHPHEAEEEGNNLPIQNVWLKRFPKKKTKLQPCPKHQYGLGWGIEFEEEWNMVRVTAMIVAAFTLAAITFLICWWKIYGDLQGAAGVGSFLLGFPAVILLVPYI